MHPKAYFFSGDQYDRYDLVADTVEDGYPQAIAGNWRNLAFTDGIDAAFLPNDGKAYFFSGDRYARYDIASDRMEDGYPRPIAGNWPGLTFTDGIDAVVLWNNGKAFFFRGSEYARYDLATDRVDDGYPLAIAGNWPGFAFTDGVDAAVLWNNGKAYFFKGDQYLRWDLATDTVDEGYPAPIDGNWPGLSLNPVRASTLWTMPPLVGHSQDPNVAAVSGEHTTGAAAVIGQSNNGRGILGISATGQGAWGASDSSTGVVGVSETGAGMWGASNRGAGVVGVSQAWQGVYGETHSSEGGAGVWGEHKGGGNGVVGVSNSGAGVYGKGRLAAFFDGDVEVTGDIRLNSADCAEEFDVDCLDLIEPGTVMVLAEEGMLRPSQHAYDKCVAGVVSGAGAYKPGIVLDRHDSATRRMPIALLGKVYCKVDASYGPIRAGDLLTTAPTPGHAMKAGDPASAFGAVLGKALRSLPEGQGLIPVLIALQ
jgi:hypothetical protein